MTERIRIIITREESDGTRLEQTLMVAPEFLDSLPSPGGFLAERVARIRKSLAQQADERFDETKRARGAEERVGGLGLRIVIDRAMPENALAFRGSGRFGVVPVSPRFWTPFPGGGAR